MAGSWKAGWAGAGCADTFKSLMSVPRKMMKSYTSADGGICGPLVRRPSVPNERTVGAQAAAHVRSAGTQAHCKCRHSGMEQKNGPPVSDTVASVGLMSDRMPS